MKSKKIHKYFQRLEVEDDASSTTTSSSFLHSITDLLKAGGVFGSMFSLFAATFDAGIITLPYLAAENGIGVAAILIIFGALISYFCAMLLVDCAEKVGKTRYEDFALHCWGAKASRLVGMCNLVSMLGFVTSYIVFVKTLIPQILQLFFGENAIPEMLGEGQWKGELVWGTVYVFCVMLPLSLPKKIGSLGYFSTLGWMCALYITLWFIFLFFGNKSSISSTSLRFDNAKYFSSSFSSMSRAIPFIVFSYMYQPIVPIIYTELNNRSRSKMRGILVFGSVFVISIYILDATFGYLWANEQESYIKTLLEEANILKVDFKSWLYNFGVLGFLFTIFSSAQVNFLSAKSEFELIFYESKEMSKFQNTVLTVCFCLICWTLGVFVPQISDSITFLGCTVDPTSGFILPILFYLTLFKEESKKYWKNYLERILCWILLLFVIFISMQTLYLFFEEKLSK